MAQGFVLLAVAVLFNGVANVLMKLGMVHAPSGSLGDAVRHYLRSWPVLLGLGLFAVNVIAYTQALARVPLSVAYPIMVSLSGAIVVLGSVYWFGESIRLGQWLGFVLILAGIVLVVR